MLTLACRLVAGGQGGVAGVECGGHEHVVPLFPGEGVHAGVRGVSLTSSSSGPSS